MKIQLKELPFIQHHSVKIGACGFHLIEVKEDISTLCYQKTGQDYDFRLWIRHSRQLDKLSVEIYRYYKDYTKPELTRRTVFDGFVDLDKPTSLLIILMAVTQYP